MRRTFGTLIASLGLFSAATLFAAPAHAAYNSNNLIDDGRFTNHTTMDEAAIQAFLNARNSGLKNYVDPSVNQSAAKIIRDAAWDFGINPQVIMATLQKEQSLMTNPTPSASNINFAMGYGCPTTGSCSFPGFYTQVRNGSWQLRFNMHRAAGNNGTWTGPSGAVWGNSSIMYACRNATAYYSTGLFPGRNVTFYAHTNGQAYATINIANASTAAMYCYTPHVYNPSGVPVYYSGSYNFVVFYERWFGPTTGEAYRSEYAGQSSYKTLSPSVTTAVAYIRYRNIGNETWYDDIGLSPAPAGTKPVHLATSNPLNRSSPVGYPWGGDRNRPAGTFAAVYEADGVTPAADQHKAVTGQIVQFNITFGTNNSVPEGVYREFFQPIVEGGSTMNTPGTYLDVTVQRPTYTSQFAGHCAYPTMVANNSSSPCFIRYKNTGNVPWYDSSSAAANNAKPVVLSTARSINRYSLLGTLWNRDQNRASTRFAAVYEADGTTLAANQAVAQPGQIVQFNFNLWAAQVLRPGVYREFFQPIVEGGSTMNDPGTFIDVTVQAPTYVSQFAGQCAYPIMVANNSSAPCFLRYKNIGNVAWYDGATAPANGVRPVVLATARPINRYSLLGTLWNRDQNRASTRFAAVYEADGTTLASNQGAVQPGQIVQYNFNLWAAAVLGPGVYREFFQPIVEGGSTMNDPGTFINITVNRP